MTDRKRVYPMQPPMLQPVVAVAYNEIIEDLHAQLQIMRLERVRIARVLDTFAHSELSMLSIQPVLELARELHGGD